MVGERLKRRLNHLWEIYQIFTESNIALLGLIFIVIIVITAIFAPIIATHHPNKLLDVPMLRPSGEYLFGTDHLGRDVFSRIIYGARVSIIVGVSAQFLSALIGVPLGLLAGYFGGRTDHAVMRLTDIFMSFPYVLLALLIAAVLGPGLENVIMALGITGWTNMCRITRVQALSIREETYVESTRSVGASHMHIIIRHIFPNSLAPILVVSTLGVATAIVGESALSFLGMGIKPPVPSWGCMLAESRMYMSESSILTIVPGMAIILAVLGFNLVGDGLRDALDPRLRKKAV